ncbi:hypothetical protein ZIOFF_005977 [Zingiber officinale]|uniref:RRM domain-containing protein n=1 Tax=Zingiber officinale TaxID=94328 RepID=A0A8J5LS09_ZINOF|nr:hypothetical protein ZIOFF_005977 [Zingiber officinale]
MLSVGAPPSPAALPHLIRRQRPSPCILLPFGSRVAATVSIPRPGRRRLIPLTALRRGHRSRKLGEGDEDAGWSQVSDEDDEDEDVDESTLPFQEMRQWLRSKPSGFGEGKNYDTRLEDDLWGEIERSRKTQMENLNKLKNKPNMSDDRPKTKEKAPHKAHASKNIDSNPKATSLGVHVSSSQDPEKSDQMYADHTTNKYEALGASVFCTGCLHWVRPLCAPPRHCTGCVRSAHPQRTALGASALRTTKAQGASVSCTRCVRSAHHHGTALGASALRTTKAQGAPFPALGGSALRTNMALHWVRPLCAPTWHCTGCPVSCTGCPVSCTGIKTLTLFDISNLYAILLLKTFKAYIDSLWGFAAADEAEPGTRVRIWNLPRKKNIHRDLHHAFRGFPGLVSISPAVIGNEKTREPVCRGFAFVCLASKEAANRFVQAYSRKTLCFGKVEKQIACAVINTRGIRDSSEPQEDVSVRFSLSKSLKGGIGLSGASDVDIVSQDSDGRTIEDGSVCIGITEKSDVEDMLSKRTCDGTSTNLEDKENSPGHVTIPVLGCLEHGNDLAQKESMPQIRKQRERTSSSKKATKTYQVQGNKPSLPGSMARYVSLVRVPFA